MKICKKCNNQKDESEFYKNSKTIDKLHSYCINCFKLDYKKNKDIKILQQKINYVNKKTDILLYHKEYSIKNKSKIQKQQKKYRENHKEIAKKYHKEYMVNRRKKDTSFKLVSILRSRIYSSLHKNIKSNNTINLIGCSINKLKDHLQQTAIKNGYLNFDINNYSGKEYHIDHIIPCSSFDLSTEEEQRKCFNWSNLQILTAKENLEKKDLINA